MKEKILIDKEVIETIIGFLYDTENDDVLYEHEKSLLDYLENALLNQGTKECRDDDKRI